MFYFVLKCKIVDIDIIIHYSSMFGKIILTFFFLAITSCAHGCGGRRGGNIIGGNFNSLCNSHRNGIMGDGNQLMYSSKNLIGGNCNQLFASKGNGIIGDGNQLAFSKHNIIGGDNNQLWNSHGNQVLGHCNNF